MGLYHPSETYDPREFPETVSPDFTLVDVLAWARTKPADEAYEYWDACGCVCGQFADFARIDCDTFGSAGYKARWAFEDKYAEELFASPCTFGAFADRLEAELAR